MISQDVATYGSEATEDSCILQKIKADRGIKWKNLQLTATKRASNDDPPWVVTSLKQTIL